MPKKASETAATKKAAGASPEQIDQLVDALADRPYGSVAAQALDLQLKKAASPPKAKPISISLPPHIIAELEEQVMENKRSGEGPRTVSGLIKLALRHYGYKL